MQRTKMCVQRVLAMLLVMLSLVGMIPLDIIEPLALTHKAKARSSGDSFRYTGWKPNFIHDGKRCSFPSDVELLISGGPMPCQARRVHNLSNNRPKFAKQAKKRRLCGAFLTTGHCVGPIRLL